LQEKSEEGHASERSEDMKLERLIAVRESVQRKSFQSRWRNAGPLRTALTGAISDLFARICPARSVVAGPPAPRLRDSDTVAGIAFTVKRAPECQDHR
jgi:hypothetical protein